jgi:hypothetical protein
MEGRALLVEERVKEGEVRQERTQKSEDFKWAGELVEYWEGTLIGEGLQE